MRIPFEPHLMGFTLIELIISILIFGVLVAIAVPSYQYTIRNNCAVSSTNNLLSLLTLARNESFRRGRVIRVCPSDSTGTQCNSSGDWANGVVVYVDANNNKILDSSEEIVRAQVPLNRCSTITYNGGSYIAFDSLSQPSSQNSALPSSAFTITARGQTTYSRKLKVSRPSKLRICNPANDSSC